MGGLPAGLQFRNFVVAGLALLAAGLFRIVLACTKQTEVEQIVEKHLGIAVTNRCCGPRFCAYDAVPAEAAAGDAPSVRD